MSKIPINFSHKKVENTNYFKPSTDSCQYSSNNDKMKQLRVNMTYQVSKINEKEMFNPTRSGVTTYRKSTYNPEMISNSYRGEFGPKTEGFKSSSSINMTSS